MQLSPDQIKVGKDARFTLIRQACPIESYFTSAKCDRSRPIKVLVYGNSSEPDGYNFMQAGYGHNPDILFIKFGTVNGCDIKRGEDGLWVVKPRCQNRLDRLLDSKFLSEVDVLVSSSNVPMNPNKIMTVHMFETLRAINPNLKIITMGGFANTKTHCSKIINETGSAASCFARENLRIFPRLLGYETVREDVLAASDHFIDRVALVCPDGMPESCEPTTPEGIPAFYDTLHLSFEYAQMLGRRYAKRDPDLFDSLLAER